MKKIREAMEQLVTKTANDIEIIQNSLSDVKDEALVIYKKSRDLYVHEILNEKRTGD